MSTPEGGADLGAPGSACSDRCEAVRAQTPAEAPGERADRSSADVSGRVGGEDSWEGGARSRATGSAEGARPARTSRILPGIFTEGDQALAPAARRAGEDVKLEGTLDELGPGPMPVRRLRRGLLPSRVRQARRQRGCRGQGPIGHHAGAPTRMRAEHPVVEEEDEIDPRARRQGGQLLEKLQRFEEEMPFWS